MSRAWSTSMAGAALLMLAAAPAVAQVAADPAATAAPMAPPAMAPEATAQIASLQRQLETLQQEQATAQQELVRLRGDAAALKAVREKNARLVAIGDELIAAYQRRYRSDRFLPFEIGRRRFEAELQAVGDRVYENRADVAAPIAAPVATAPR